MANERVVTRQLDELNRIVIPADIREALGWGAGTKLEISLGDVATKSVTICGVSPCCTLCRSESENLLPVGKGYVCPGCAAKIKQKL